MKKSVSVFFAWTFISIAMTVSAFAAGSARIAYVSSVISPMSPYILTTFTVTDAPVGGVRYLVQARGIRVESSPLLLDTEMTIYAEREGRTVLIAGNDNWQQQWSNGEVTTLVNPAQMQ